MHSLPWNTLEVPEGFWIFGKSLEWSRFDIEAVI